MDVKFDKDICKLNNSKSKRHGVYRESKGMQQKFLSHKYLSPYKLLAVIVINPIIPEKYKSIDEIIKKYYIITGNIKEDREYMEDIIILIGQINKPLSDKIKNTRKLSGLTKYLELIGIIYDKNKNKLKDHQSGKKGVYVGIKRNEIELEIPEQPTEINPPK